MTHEELANSLRGCNVVITCDSVSLLASHNCLLVNDTFLLSYRQGEDILARQKAASAIAGAVQGLAERFVGWALQFIYRVSFKTQVPIIMEKADGQASETPAE